MIITHPHVHVRDADLSGFERDALVLSAEERRRGRRRVTTRKGRELALPMGRVLVPREILPVVVVIATMGTYSSRSKRQQRSGVVPGVLHESSPRYGFW